MPNKPTKPNWYVSNSLAIVEFSIDSNNQVRLELPPEQAVEVARALIAAAETIKPTPQKPPRKKKCFDCKGRGEIPAYDNMGAEVWATKCETCKGTGKYPGSSTPTKEIK